MHVLRTILTAALALGFALAPNPAAAELDAEAALELARTQWFEGMPADRVEPLSREAHQALGALLEDPAEVEHHAAALELLGRAGGRAAFPLIRKYQRSAEGNASDDTEVSSAGHRARLAVPVALGYLARHDDRALRHLLREADRTDAPRWHTKRISADRTARVHREVCAIGLGLSGRDEAEGALRRMRGAGSPEAWSRHLGEALEMHRQHATRGGRGQQ
jgi:hypothetical protein